MVLPAEPNESGPIRNDIAIKAYREGKLPFPDGTITARLAWRQVISEGNNVAFRRAAERRGLSSEQITKLLAEPFVAGPAKDVQFMIKDSKKIRVDRRLGIRSIHRWEA